jgi:prophage regulatory protein
MSSNFQQQVRRALSIKETAEACGLSRATLYRLMAEGKLATLKIGAGRLVPVVAIDTLLGGRKMRANESSAPRTDVASLIDFKSHEDQIKARTTDLHPGPARLDSGTFNVAPRPLKSCRDTPNNLNPFGTLPEVAYIRQSQLIPAIFPFSSATLSRKVKAGKFPQPIKLGPRITGRRVDDIRELIERLGR